VTSAQIALAWVLARMPWIVPIPGTTNVLRLRENISAADIELTPEDSRDIENAVAGITVQGARYPAWMQETVGR
jgi:aryl-alcohol dehydrogenase-like predicted oxidoreductase